MPTKVLDLIEAYFRSFVWSVTNKITKKALVSQEKVCVPRASGGLDLIKMVIWNKVVITKTYWDLTHKDDKLWIKWINEYNTKDK